MKILYKNKQDKIFPKKIEEKPSFIKVNNKYFKTYYVAEYPSEVYSFFLSDIFSLGGNIMVTQYLKAVKKDQILNSIKMKLSAIEAQRHSRFKKGKLNDITLDLEVSNLEDFRRILVSSKETSLSFGFYLTLYSKNLYRLKSLSKNLELLLSSKSFNIYSLDFRQDAGYKTILPFNLNISSKSFILNTKSVAYMTPFVLSNYTDYSGVIYGVNSLTNSMLIFDIFKYENYNGVVFAKSGSGKSFFAKINIIRSLSKGIKVVVIDPEGEYKDLCKNLKGKYIDLSHKSKNHINPFDLYEGESIDEKIQFIKSFLRKTCTYFDSNEIDKALIEIFRDFKNPTFVDLYNFLEKKNSRMALEIFNISKGSNSNLYSNESNIKLSSKDNLIVFDISSLDSYNISLMMHVVLNFIWKFHQRQDKRLVFIDEAHRLFENEDLLSYLKMVSKRARKYNLGLIYITQDIEDFISSEEGRSIIANTSLKVLMKQEKVNVEKIGKTFMLSSEEKEALLKFSLGESLILFGDLRVYNKVFAFEFEEKIFNKRQEIP